jgi:hypothetical protein
MLVRWTSALLLAAIGFLPVAPDALAFATAKPAKPVVVRRIPMTFAERLKDDSSCHRSAPASDALIPVAVADIPASSRVSCPPPAEKIAGIHPQTDFSHTPELPASNRIRAPSV